MRITVILCTYNRCHMLAKALESVAGSAVPQEIDWEILVVDNNSRDATRGVVGEYCRRYPGRFRYLFEPQPGKSYALNAGIREANGDVLAFMDDDVTVESTWLQNLTAVLHSGEWAGAGGRILPERNFSPPRWLSLEGRYALAPLAIFDLGTQAGELTEAPFGTNMAFSKRMFEKYGEFRIDLGPRPGSEIRNEDTEFGLRLLAGGERLWYEPSSVVYHSVARDRVQKKYFLAWWFDKARADMRQSAIRRDSKWYVMGIPLYLLRRLVVWTLRWLVTVEPSRRFSCKVNAWTVAGSILECHHQRREAKRQGGECNA